MKVDSSAWLKRKSPDLADFYWQGGYGAFSVSQSNESQVRAYIASQEEHHRRVRTNSARFCAGMKSNLTSGMSGIEESRPVGAFVFRCARVTQG
jgi:hypothetical protein